MVQFPEEARRATPDAVYAKQQVQQGANHRRQPDKQHPQQRWARLAFVNDRVRRCSEGRPERDSLAGRVFHLDAIPSLKKATVTAFGLLEMQISDCT